MRLKKRNFDYRYAAAFFVLFAVEAFIAVFINDNFIRPYVGDVLVVILIYCFLRIFIVSPVKLLPLYMFLFSTCIEVAQYFNFVSILGLQDYRIARIILGAVFDLKDILCYLAGCILLFIYQEAVRRFTVNRKLTEE